MSDRYFGDNRRRGPAGFGSSGRRTTFGYWIPLALTVTVATAGLAAWIWSERSEDDGDEYHDGEGGRAPITLDPGVDDATSAGGASTGAQTRGQGDEDSVISRMQGAWRRTPSPQQLFDGASKRVAAGVAAAGAAVGGALSAIREEGPNDYEDHSRWAQDTPSTSVVESQARAPSRQAPQESSGPPSSSKKRKTVAIVVSSVCEEAEGDTISPHASILAHLPEAVEPDTARVFVLIYAPGMPPRMAPESGSPRPPLSMASSYSNISPEEATGAEPLKDVEPRPTSDEFPSAPPFFKTLYGQAQTLVDKDAMIIPFSTPTGHVHILRHIAPDLVYVQESLTGEKGEAVHNLTAWVRQVIVVIGDDGGRGGLIDSDDESVSANKGERWWQEEGVIGLGKRIDVVDALRAGDDWKRRVCGHD